MSDGFVGNKGFAIIPTWLVRSPNYTALQKLTFAVLSSYADEGGICYPSQTTVAGMLGCSERTVKRTIRDLRRMGLLEVRATSTPTGRRNSYRLLIDRRGGL